MKTFSSVANGTDTEGSAILKWTWSQKEKDCLFGYCLATFKNNGRIIKYIFNEQGFETLNRVVFNKDN